MKADFVLLNIENVDNTTNELFNKHTINRNFKKLLDNDKQLKALQEEVVQNQVEIQEYSSGNTYCKGQLVWFASKNMHNNENCLYLLESLYDNNNSVPTLIYNENNEYSFVESGWKDKNEYTTVIENGLSSIVVLDFISKINIYHEFDENYHKYGKLTSDKSNNNTKILLNNISNIDTNRQLSFFPYQTCNLKTDNVILNGFYRKWDNGLLEYDIIFKLASVGNEFIDGAYYDILSCNTLSIDSSPENSKYFVDDEAKQIFLNRTDDVAELKFEDTILKNRNKFVNTYSATILFPEKFADLNYMVFLSDIRCQERNTSTLSIDPGANTMTYVNKKNDSITALYVMFPLDQQYNSLKNGLISNSFHCQVIGRWK